jgi:hypothetical protein
MYFGVLNSWFAFLFQFENRGWWYVVRFYMAIGQLKVTAQPTYGVTNGTVATTSPDSSGSPQRCE